MHNILASSSNTTILYIHSLEWPHLPPAHRRTRLVCQTSGLHAPKTQVQPGYVIWCLWAFGRHFYIAYGFFAAWMRCLRVFRTDIALYASLPSPQTSYGSTLFMCTNPMIHYYRLRGPADHGSGSLSMAGWTICQWSTTHFSLPKCGHHQCEQVSVCDLLFICFSGSKDV